MTLSPGTRLGHFEILAPLGSGGMGEVYRARDLNLERVVAVKVLPENISEQADALSRFDRDVRAIATLNDAHILTIHDYGDHEGRRYAVTELLEGETLAERIALGPVEWKDALDIAIDVARGLAAAHRKSVIHRDIKPSNIFITHTGTVKILDFGLACTVDPGMLETVAPGGAVPLHATPSAILGTVGYMSPEQVRDEPVDPSSDIFSFGCVLFEMLTGQRPFQRQTAADTIAAILNADTPELSRFKAELPPGFQPIVGRCLNKSIDQRFTSGSQLLSSLLKLKEDLTPSEMSPTEVRRKVNKPAIGVVVVVLLALIAGALGSAAFKRSRQNFARKEVLPEIQRLTQEGRYVEALRLAEEATEVIPEDAKLQELMASARHPVTVESDPVGAEVYFKDYEEPEADWTHLGKTPLLNVQVPRGLLRWKLELDGYVPIERGTPSTLPVSTAPPLNFTLETEAEAIEGMVYVEPGVMALPFSGFDPLEFLMIPGYHMDQHEVTNSEYLEFVQQEGYQNRDYWVHPFVDESGAEIPFDEAMDQFVDPTGRPGPSTWELGRFPEGHAEMPVSGISWYEAAAFAEFKGKELPTLHQWGRAALSPMEAGSPVSPKLAPISNYGSQGPWPSDDHLSLSPSGAVNMAGNVREWSWTPEEDGRRYILGGAWDDPPSMLTLPHAAQPTDRSPGNGFRCVQFAGRLPSTLMASVPRKTFAFEVQPRLSEDAFRLIGSRFEVPAEPLTAQIESVDDADEDWILETVSVPSAYGESPLRILVYLPRNSAPPYQAVIYYPGADFIFLNSQASIAGHASYQQVTFIPRSGRALILPIFRGTLESANVRRVNAPGNLEYGGKDLSQTLQYLEGREDIDADQIAYLGFGMGSIYGGAYLPFFPEFKAAVLVSGGLAEFPGQSEFSLSGLLPYIELPLLTLNGEYDYLFPPETSQRPFFELISTPEEDKRRVLYKAGHWPLPRHELIEETLGWLDKYLGPVEILQTELADAEP